MSERMGLSRGVRQAAIRLCLIASRCIEESLFFESLRAIAGNHRQIRREPRPIKLIDVGPFFIEIEPSPLPGAVRKDNEVARLARRELTWINGHSTLL